MYGYIYIYTYIYVPRSYIFSISPQISKISLPETYLIVPWAYSANTTLGISCYLTDIL